MTAAMAATRRPYSTAEAPSSLVAHEVANVLDHSVYPSVALMESPSVSVRPGPPFRPRYDMVRMRAALPIRWRFGKPWPIG